jgi:hypothetical protein
MPVWLKSTGKKSRDPQHGPVQPGSHKHIPDAHPPLREQSRSVVQVGEQATLGTRKATAPKTEKKRNAATIDTIFPIDGEAARAGSVAVRR